MITQNTNSVHTDLIKRSIYSHCSIHATGNMFTRRPDLFGAVHCLVPLLDMRSYNKLLGEEKENISIFLSFFVSYYFCKPFVNNGRIF